MTTNYDPTDLRGHDRGKREDDARKRLIREMEAADVKWLMSSRKGRRIGVAAQFSAYIRTRRDSSPHLIA